MGENKYQHQIIILIGTLISCFIGFYNSYPLVYSDTGSYLSSGFLGEVPLDRPIFYGLFLRHISLSASPWLIIIVQSFLTNWLLHTTLSIFFEGIKRNLFFLSSILILTLTTGFSYNISILLPDIFCAIALLSLINLLINSNLSKTKIFLISILFVFSLTTHLSNIPTIGIVLIVINILNFIKKRQKKTLLFPFKKIIISFSLFLFASLLIPTVNYLNGSNFRLSNASHVFTINHLIQCGVMEEYLKDNCENSDFTLCKFKNDLTDGFLWDKESVLYKTGGWNKNKDEYNTIISQIFSNPKYWPLLIQKSIEYTSKQYFTFETSVFPPQLKGSAPYGQIEWRFHDSLREYTSSKQNRNQLSTKFLNIIETFLILISLLFISITVIYKNISSVIKPNFKNISILLLLYSFINSAVTSNLSTVDARYQNRWIWLLVFFTIIGINLLYKNYKTTSVK